MKLCQNTIQVSLIISFYNIKMHNIIQKMHNVCIEVYSTVSII